MRHQFLTAAAVSAGCALSSHAGVLWDQSKLDWNANGFTNTISGNPNTSYMVSDVTVGAGGWTVNSISVYFTCFDFNWATGADATTGRLNVFSKTGALPTSGNNPGTGSLVSLDVEILNDPTVGQAYYKVTASNLNLNLSAGSYWLGVTPVEPNGFFGPESGLAATTHLGAASAWRSPYTGFGLPPANTWTNTLYGNLDAAILVEGVPAPTSLAAVGVAGLLVGRRRR